MTWGHTHEIIATHADGRIVRWERFIDRPGARAYLARLLAYPLPNVPPRQGTLSVRAISEEDRQRAEDAARQESADFAAHHATTTTRE